MDPILAKYMAPRSSGGRGARSEMEARFMIERDAKRVDCRSCGRTECSCHRKHECPEAQR